MPVKVKVRARRVGALEPDSVRELVRQAGDRGLTGRELAVILSLEPMRCKKALARCPGLVHEWSPCADHATHYQLQEGRYRCLADPQA